MMKWLGKNNLISICAVGTWLLFSIAESRLCDTRHGILEKTCTYWWAVILVCGSFSARYSNTSALPWYRVSKTPLGIIGPSPPGNDWASHAGKRVLWTTLFIVLQAYLSMYIRYSEAVLPLLDTAMLSFYITTPTHDRLHQHLAINLQVYQHMKSTFFCLEA